MKQRLRMEFVVSTNGEDQKQPVVIERWDLVHIFYQLRHLGQTQSSASAAISALRSLETLTLEHQQPNERGPVQANSSPHISHLRVLVKV